MVRNEEITAFTFKLKESSDSSTIAPYIVEVMFSDGRVIEIFITNAEKLNEIILFQQCNVDSECLSQISLNGETVFR